MKPLLEVFECQPEHLQCRVAAVLSKSKTMARAVKASWLPTLGFDFGHEIPPRIIADQLVEGYLRTYESVFRILHVPSFRAEYNKFWQHPPASAHPAFLIQLQLVMAVGSAVYDSVHSQKRSAVRWVYEAQCWLLKPPTKSKLTLMALQNMLLLCLARESAAVGADLVWIDVGSLVRSAILMGLHRDPRHLPRTNRLVSEMRRRLWNTIFEISLNASLVSGGPALISLDDTDTSAPDDCNDDDLDETCQDDVPIPRREGITDMSAALALRQSFPLRLAIARLLNDVSSKGRYEDTLRLSSQLQSMYRTVIASMKTAGNLGARQLTAFQQGYVEFVFHRYLLSLHVPYLKPSIREPTYAFSRIMVIEMALKIYCAVSPRASFNQQDDTTEIASSTPSTDLSRLCDCTAGTLRGVVGQVVMVIVLELYTQIHENRNGFVSVLISLSNHRNISFSGFFSHKGAPSCSPLSAVSDHGYYRAFSPRGLTCYELSAICEIGRFGVSKPARPTSKPTWRCPASANTSKACYQAWSPKPSTKPVSKKPSRGSTRCWIYSKATLVMKK